MRLITLVTLIVVLVSACTGAEEATSDVTEISLPEDTQFVQAASDPDTFASQVEVESEPTMQPTAIPTDTPDETDVTPEPTEVIANEPAETTSAANEPCDYRDGWVVYVIQGGDTLWELSAQTGTTVVELQEANCLDSDVLTVGKRFVVPRLPDTTD